MKNTSVIIIILIACFGMEARSKDIKALLNKVPPTHPRLFMRRGEEDSLRKKIAADLLLSQAFEHVTTVSDGILSTKPVKRKKTGKRLLSVSRMALKRATYLSFAGRMTKNPQYAARLEKELLAAAAFSDWNPSHFLDVGEMTAALAIGYDWLYDELSAEARKTIKAAIIEKGLKTSLKGGWWVKKTNNWNQVCHGGLVLGALAVMEDEPELAVQIIERAIQNVPRAMAEYAPDGAYPEGPGYWKYGTTYNVVLLSALESVLGTDFDLSRARGFLESSDYYLHATGPTGLFFNYSDCGTRGAVSPAMYWFAAKRKQPSLLWRERQELIQFLEINHNPDRSSGRFFPFLLIWASPLKSISPPPATQYTANGRSPIGIHRSGWNNARETFVGIKAGSPGVNHAHMDIGSFVLDAKGVRWAVDLGSQSYHSLESKGVVLWNRSQNSQRWNVFRLNNFSHNTLVVDGQKQRVNGRASILSFSDKAPTPHTIVDMSAVYKGQLAAAKRTIGLRKNQSVLVQDELKTLDRKTAVRWGMVTRAKVTITSDRSAVLKQDGEEFFISVLNPENAKLELFDTENPPESFDARNPDTRMIGFHTDIPASTNAHLHVLLSPDKL